MSFHKYAMFIRLQTGIAMAGSLFIIYSYTRFVELRTKGFKLVFNLVVCDFLATSVTFWYDYPPEKGSFFCTLQASFIQFFGLAAFLWTLMISCTLYAAVSRTCHGVPSCLDRFIHRPYLVHGCIWSISAISIIVPWITDSIGPAGYTCWIIEHPRPFGIVWRFTFFYAVGFFVILTSIYQSIKVRGWVELLVLNKMHEAMKAKGEVLPKNKGASWAALQDMRKRAGSTGTRVLLQHSNIIKLHHQLKWYPLILTISWGYRCSCRLSQALSNEFDQNRYLDTENKTSGLLFIFAGGFAMQATLNFLIYGFTPAVRKAWTVLWHEVVVEGNMISLARFESYAVSSPTEEDDGYDPRYEDSESNDAYPSFSQEKGVGYDGGLGPVGGQVGSASSSVRGSRVEQRLSASLEMGKYGGNSLRQQGLFPSSVGSSNGKLSMSSYRSDKNDSETTEIVSESNHI